MEKNKIERLLASSIACCWCPLVAISIIFLFVMLVLHGWPVGDWQLGWGAFGALSSFGTGAIAAKIAYEQKKQSDFVIRNKKKIFEERINDFSGLLEKRMILVVNRIYGTLYRDFITGDRVDPGLTKKKLSKSAVEINQMMRDEKYFPDFIIEDDDFLFLNEDQLDSVVNYKKLKKKVSKLIDEQFIYLTFMIYRSDYLDYSKFVVVLISSIWREMDVVLGRGKIIYDYFSDLNEFMVVCENDLRGFEKKQTNKLAISIYSI